MKLTKTEYELLERALMKYIEITEKSFEATDEITEKLMYDIRAKQLVALMLKMSVLAEDDYITEVQLEMKV